MNILVFGKNGQLGRAFQEQLQQTSFQAVNNIRFVGKNECDFSKLDQLKILLQDFRPQLMINAAAYTSVDEAESELDIALAINATAPEMMAKYAAHHCATLLHFSTDYVFDGSKQGVYTEADQTNPLSVYGKSKEAGELAIAKVFSKNAGGQYAILRASWVYGDGRNFIHTILRLAKERSELRVIDDQIGVPTSARWLADLSLHLVLDDAEQIRQFISGIYHAVPRGQTNWHSLACLAVKVALDADQKLQASFADIVPIPTSDYPLLARRPMNSLMSTDKLKFELERLGLVSKLPHWNTPWDQQVAYYIKRLLAT